MPRQRVTRTIGRIPILAGIATLLTVVTAGTTTLGAGDERALWEVWKLHQDAPDDHEAVAAACEEFVKTHTRDPFIGVADTLGAWHLIKAKRYADGIKILAKYTDRPNDSLSRAANMVASSWLTRIDRERIKIALQFYYRREIGYPRNLKELAAYEALPKKLAFREKDWWDNPWDYRLVGFKRIPNLLNQKYRLRSSKLGEGSDLAEALALPYGSEIRVRPLAVNSALRHGLELIEMEILPEADENATADTSRRPKTAMVGAGTMTEGVFLAHIGEKILIVCDRCHWKLFGKPASR